MRTQGTVRKVIRSTLFGGAALLLVGADGCDLIYRYVQCILNGECTYLAADFFGFSSEEEPPPLPQRNAGVPAAAASGAEFGASLAAPTTGVLTGQSVRLVVGAPSDQTDAGATGAVYVYSGPYDSAAEPIQLVPSDGESGARFGAAVDIQRFESFDIILVGAPGSYPSGAVYVFESNGSAWVQTARFVPDGDDYYSEFGGSVAIVRSVTVGDTLAVVGAPSGGDGGHVSVFRRSSGGVWAVDADGGHEPSFQPADVSQGDRFGACLATVGRFVAVGAPGRGGYMGAGAAFLFSYDAATGAWTESPTRMEPEGTPS